MKEIVVTRSHNLGQQSCMELADKITDSLIDRIGGSKEVDGSVIKYSHVSGSKGTLTSSENTLEVRVKLGFLVRSLGKSIESEINQLCDKHLN